MALMINFVPQDPAAAAGGGAKLDELKKERSVSGKVFDRKRPAVRDEATKDFRPVTGRIPAGDYVLPVADAKGKAPGKSARLAAAPGLKAGQGEDVFGKLPVRLRQATKPARSQNASSKKASKASSKKAAPGTLAKVQVKDAKTARKAGIEGVLFTAAPAAASTADAASGAVQVEVDYSSIKDSFGANWGSRLRLVQLPGCALTTPEKTSCRTPAELGGTNDVKDATVKATVDLGTASKARSAAAPRVFAATAAASGPGGSHEATSLSPSGSWMAGSSSGGFSWTYPIETQEVPGGPQPEIALSYSSQAVDGRTASTNAQSSWIAEGWDYDPGFIERRFRSCSDDKAEEDGKKPNNPSTDTGDLCWGSDHVVMSLGGNNTELVKDDVKNTWRPADDDGTKVERRTGATNGADNGSHDREYWVVTGTDGVEYHFGLNKLPGAPADKRTNSVQTVPVVGNHPGEPCYTTAFTGSECTQAYRWNLDYVVDPLGDAMSLWWNKETNYYGLNSKADQQVSYTRSAQLARIDYGQRSDKLFTAEPAGRVLFTTAERCVPNATFDCAVSKRTKENAKHWPDTPLDQECASGAKCTDKFSPTFWSTKRLVKITSQVLAGTALKTVDSWALDSKFPATGDGTSPALWLDSITRTGHGAGGTAAMPKVTFAGVQMDNRVDGIEGLPPYSRYRITSIDTETGGRIGVTYSPRECSALEPKKLPASPESNTLRCYPQYWMPKGALKMYQDWFHKYLVTEVREMDLVTDAQTKTTSYEFIGSPAWAFDDSEFAEKKYRTWSQYRGYERVRTRMGTGDDVKQLSEHRYFRGMHGDKLPTGTRTSVVEDSRGGSVNDLPHFQGQMREQISYESDGGPVDSSTLTNTWAVKTASRARPGTTPLEAWMSRPETVSTRERVKGDTWRTSTEKTTYDSYGLPTEVDETTPGGKRMCSTTEYARNTTAYLVESESRNKTTLGACGTAGGKVVEDTRTHFDGLGFGVAPIKGLPTKVEELNAKGDGYTTIDRTEYDIHGRETATYDTDNKKTSVLYTPATVARPVKMVSTDPLGHTETTEFDDARGLPLAEIDANNKRAVMEYDPLGRLMKVWEIDRDPATQTPTATYDYTIRRDGPTIVTSRTVKDNGEYSVSYEILDGLLRERQTQDEAVGGPGRIVNDSFYDSAGRVHKTNDGYYNNIEPEPKLLQVGDHQVPAQSRTTFNGMGESIADITYHNGTEKLRTTTEVDGDVSTTIPPKGDTVTATFENAEGQVEKLREYTNEARTEFRDTLYEYDDLENLTKVTAPGGAVTTFEYDGRGRQTSVTDPDGGKTSYGYDATDNVVSTTDPRGNKLVTTYDDGGRPTALHQESDTGALTKRMGWTYDTLGKGLPTASIRYEGTREYRDEVTAYDNAYRVKAAQTVIPAEEKGLGGTYGYEYTYTPTGNVSVVKLPGLGGLTTERVIFRYNTDDLPTSIAGATTYLNDVTYSPFGEIMRTEAGPATKRVYGSYIYDEFTRRLMESTHDRSLAPGRIADTRYTYDQAGNLTKLADTPGAAVAAEAKTDTQCFVHNQLRQMTSAWTSSTAECAAQPAAANVGGPDAYWQSYEFDKAGNRTKLVEHDITGDTTQNVTRTYAYGKPGIGGPNALAEVKSTGPGGERLNTFAYDKAGNTTTRQHKGTTQTLDWDVEGQLRSVSSPVEGGGTKKTEYLYDTSGDRLIRTAADGAKTLYLGEAELTVSADLTTQKAERFYAHPDGSVTVRSTGGGRSLMLADHHGTTNTVVDMVGATMDVTRRKSMPFGEERGAAPSTWPGSRGFVGGTADKDTGLTKVGARNYDPVTGRFISVDPLVDYSQPATINPYAYANNSPATFSDPSGLFFPILIGMAARIAIQAAIRAAARKAAQIAARKAAQAAARRAAALARKRALEAAKRAAAKAKREAAKKAAAAKRAAAKRAAQRAAAKRAAQKRAAAAARAKAQRAAARKAAAKRAAVRKAAARPKPKPKPRAQPKPKPKPSQAKRPAAKKVAKEVRSEAKSQAQEQTQGITCENNSFVAGTLVLMADGSKKPIDQIKTGDKVIATDPKTGKTKAQTVSGALTHSGYKQMVKITIRDKSNGAATAALAVADGGDSASRSSVTSTDEHPFWVEKLGRWVDADDLEPGQLLKTSSGAWAQIETVQSWTAQQRVYNLTVNDTHTYYVLAGAASVLVHNCDDADLQKELTQLGRAQIEKVKANLGEDEILPGAFSVGRDRTTGKTYYGESGPETGHHAGVKSRLPVASQLENGRPPGVCAEARMCTNALNDGASLDNLDIITLNQKGKKFKMCPNCQTWVPRAVRKVLTG